MPEYDDAAFQESLKFSKTIREQYAKARIVQDSGESGRPSAPKPARSSSPDFGAGARPLGPSAPADDMGKILRAARHGINPNQL
jgi:hypothetical protein